MCLKNGGFLVLDNTIQTLLGLDLLGGGWAARSVASVVATGQPEHEPGQGVYSAAALALGRGLARFATQDRRD